MRSEATRHSVDERMKGKTCAYCGRKSQGMHSIHRDGFGVGPEVPLCNACGSRETPSCAAIWDRIAKPSADRFAHRREVPRG